MAGYDDWLVRPMERGDGRDDAMDHWIELEETFSLYEADPEHTNYYDWIDLHEDLFEKWWQEIQDEASQECGARRAEYDS